MRSLFGGRSHHGSSHGLTAQEEELAIEQAMLAVAQIMNDDVQAADAGLSSGDSPFHKMGKGVVTFLRATLGFEQDVMKEASERLAEAEASAAEHQRYATKTDGAFKSKIYPQGTEYALCLAQAQLMSAVVGLLNESLKESVMGFYKLRKAYITLDGILAAEHSYAQKQSSSSLAWSGTNSLNVSIPTSKASSAAASSTNVTTSQSSITPSTVNATKPSKTDLDDGGDDDDDDDFVDADETHDKGQTTGEYMGHLEVQDSDGHKTHIIDRSGIDHSDIPDISEAELERAATNLTLREGNHPDVFGDNPIDIVVLSGSNMCFGLLSLMISLIPPAFGRLLSIVGFRGDRMRGINMLWQSTRFDNLYGGMGGLVLFGYYNVIVGFCDIVPLSGEGSYPRDRLARLIVQMRTRYPKSRLWFLEEVRGLSYDRQLEKAVNLMENAPESPLRQLEALQAFEKSLDLMYLHSYAKMSTSFLRCVELNSWSPGLYYFAAASAHVQLYRQARAANDDTEARLQAKRATEFYLQVPNFVGRKKLMARQLPFDTFITRKINKWLERSKAWGVELVDAVGVAPIEELIYFWNGYKRMRAEHLEVSLANLEWSPSAANPHWAKEDLDERSIYHLLKAATLRMLRRHDEAKQILRDEIMCHERALFNGGLKDNWTPACAHYEMAVNYWMVEADKKNMDEVNLRECSRHVEATANWESYDLDARMGMRLTTARDTLKRLGVGP